MLQIHTNENLTCHAVIWITKELWEFQWCGIQNETGILWVLE